MLMKCYASSVKSKNNEGGKSTSRNSKSSPSRGAPANRTSPTRGRSGLSNARMNYYKNLWENDQIGVRTMVTRMQNEGASNAQISTAIKWN